MGYPSSNSKEAGITGNVGPCQSGREKGGPVAFIGGETHPVVADGLTEIL
jgi:hypothetical protein